MNTAFQPSSCFRLRNSDRTCRPRSTMRCAFSLTAVTCTELIFVRQELNMSSDVKTT